MSALSERVDALSQQLRPHYARFLAGAGDDVLLTAHSHQAWPDVSREAHLQAWDDAAAMADKKWAHVFGEVLPEFQRRVVQRLGSERAADLALAPNTHELVYRLLSCFPPEARVLTTDSEFHSLRRQLSRSAEESLRVQWVQAGPGLADRLGQALREAPTQLLALSQVFFTDASVVLDLETILQDAASLGVPVLVDTYHSFNVLPMAVDDWPGEVFVVGGGYKYAQSGEAACWMLLPPDCQLRPRHTGWFADFEHLETNDGVVRYCAGGFRFMGSTFDPSPFYRGRAVLAWMDAQGLSPERLRRATQDGTELIIEGWARRALQDKGLTLGSPRDRRERAGFVTFEHPRAQTLCALLDERGIRTDVRGTRLRLGPAPYTSSTEIDRALQTLSEIL
ncbi:MAG: hypothetical protein AAGD10_07110 [Myxococcota bacterium]